MLITFEVCHVDCMFEICDVAFALILVGGFFPLKKKIFNYLLWR